MFRLIDLCILQDACHELFCIFGDFYASCTQDAEVTKSLGLKCLYLAFRIQFEMHNREIRSKYSNKKNYLWLKKVLTMVSHVSFIDLVKLLKRNSPDYLNNQVFPSINFGLVS